MDKAAKQKDKPKKTERQQTLPGVPLYAKVLEAARADLPRCIVKDCERLAIARCLCGMHYRTWRSGGTLPPLRA